MTNSQQHQNTAYGCGITIATCISIALWACIYFLVCAITSCSTQETAAPSLCESITSDHYASQRVHLVIDSKEPDLTFTWSLNGNVTHEITVAYPYYHEMWLVLCFGHVLTINGECEVM